MNEFLGNGSSIVFPTAKRSFTCRNRSDEYQCLVYLVAQCNPNTSLVDSLQPFMLVLRKDITQLLLSLQYSL